MNKAGIVTVIVMNVAALGSGVRACRDLVHELALLQREAATLRREVSTLRDEDVKAIQQYLVETPPDE